MRARAWSRAGGRDAGARGVGEDVGGGGGRGAARGAGGEAGRGVGRVGRRPAGLARRVCSAAALGSWAALGLLLGGPGAARAAEVKQLGRFDDWGAFVVEDGSNKHCFARTVPTKSEGNYRERGEIALTVSHRPGDGVRNEVSVLAGYDYQDQSRVELAVAGKKFFLFVDGDAAWAETPKAEVALVEALERGSTLVVKGTSRRGTRTTDTYSLKGSSAALRSIAEACPKSS
jgi:hypothetical protein